MQGGVLMEGRDNTIKGDWRALWCQNQDGTWRLYTRAVLDKYKTLSADAIAAMAEQVWLSDSPVNTLNALIDGAAVLPPAGSQDLFDFQSLHFAACKQGVALPPTTPVTDNCVVPTPLPVPTVLYVVTGAQAYPLNPNGTRSYTPWPVNPIKGEPCDSTVSVVSFNVVFYRVPSLSTTQTVVAGCTKTP